MALDLTRTEHRLLQVILHFGFAPSELLKIVIEAGKPNRTRPIVTHPASWLKHLNAKIGPAMRIQWTDAGYALARGAPLRDRAAYMREYRARRP